jgi:hypothetical protein
MLSGHIGKIGLPEVGVLIRVQVCKVLDKVGVVGALELRGTQIVMVASLDLVEDERKTPAIIDGMMDSPDKAFACRSIVN